MSRSHASKSFLYNLPSMCFSVSFLQGTVHLPCNQFCARYGTCALPFNQFCARYFTVRVHVPFSFVQGTVHVSYCTVSFVQGTVHVFYCTASFVQGTVLKPFNQFVQGTVHTTQVFKKVINLLSHCKILKNMFTELHNVSNLAKY